MSRFSTLEALQGGGSTPEIEHAIKSLMVWDLANALIDIVAQPWRVSSSSDGEEWADCPVCGADVEFRGHGHYDGCAWLIAARALGIA